MTRLAKIHATIGPASSDPNTLRRMVDAGMDGCRLNMSHCSHGQARELTALVRRVSKELRRPIAIAADLRGPKLRIGDVAGGAVFLKDGATVVLTSEDRITEQGLISVNYPYLAEDVHPGDPVLLNDGAIALRVETIKEKRVICSIEKGGELTSRKGFNLPGIPLRVPSLTSKDLRDIALAVEIGVDFLYLSFARSRQHVQDVRDALARLGSNLPLVAKIERQEGADALAEIVAAADGICIARGDLGIETPLGTVPEIQREAPRLCRAAGKFVMMGGQVLSSMVSRPTPLRAEVADIAAAVRDGHDGIILSDETAAGDYPVDAVRAAAQVIAHAEASVVQAADLADCIPAARVRGLGPVVVVSRDGRAVERLSTSRSASPIVAVVDRPNVANWLSGWWGIVPVLLEDCSDPAAAARRAIDIVSASEPALAQANPIILVDIST